MFCLGQIANWKIAIVVYNKSFIDQGSSVKMAEYCSFFAFMDLNFVSVQKNAWKELRQDRAY